MVLMRRILRTIIESRITIHATSSAPTESIEHTNAQVQMHAHLLHVHESNWLNDLSLTADRPRAVGTTPRAHGAEHLRFGDDLEKKLVKLSYVSHAMLRK